MFWCDGIISSGKGALTCSLRFAFYQEGLFQNQRVTLIGKGKSCKTLLERYISSFLPDMFLLFVYSAIGKSLVAYVVFFFPRALEVTAQGI